MSWRDALRPASFRGVAFYVSEATIGAGRRLARHEYPQRDLPYLEDMGRKAREYKVEAYILGSNYMRGRDALLAAIEKAGSGQLVHPWHGTLVVVVQDCQLSEGTASGGYAKFSLTFVEAGKREAPVMRADTRGKVIKAKSRLRAAVEAAYAKAMDLVAVPVSLVQDAMEGLNELREVAGVAVALAQGSYGAAINALLPGNVSAALAEPVSAVRGFYALADSLVDVSGLLNFDRPSSPAWSPVAARRNVQRQQMVLAVRQAAMERRVSDLLTVNYATVVDARQARVQLVAAVDAVLLHPGLDQQSAQAVVDFRTAALAHLDTLAQQLPALFSVENRRVRPALVIAHECYGDDWLKYGRDATLITRNKVRHPGLVPAGTLQLEVMRASA